MWSELSDKCTAAFYVYCNGRRNCTCYRETKASREIAIFQNIVGDSFEFLEAWIATSKAGPWFAGLMLLVVGNSEGKERFCSKP